MYHSIWLYVKGIGYVECQVLEVPGSDSCSLMEIFVSNGRRIHLLLIRFPHFPQGEVNKPSAGGLFKFNKPGESRLC
jgi:hypothetical protein